MALHFVVASLPLVVPAVGLAFPNPQQSPNAVLPPTCNQDPTYPISNQYQATSLPIQLGGHCQTAGCMLTFSNGVSFSVTVNVGADLGIDTDAVSVGISAGISYSKETSTVEETTVPCGPTAGTYMCGAFYTAELWRVEGEKIVPGCNSPADDQGPYSVDYPLQDDSGLLEYNLRACVCPNGPNPVATDDLPVCPEDC